MNGNFLRIFSAIVLCATFVLGFVFLNGNEKEKQVDASVVTNKVTTTKETTTEESTTAEETTEELTTELLTQAPEKQEVTTAAPVNTSIEYQLLEAVNQERANAGVAPLSMSETLCQAAQIRANEIISVFSHTRPDGSDCFSAFNISYSAAGENIAAGQRDVSSVMTSWMNSEGHRANILSADFDTFACALVYDSSTPYGYYWVQLFARQ